MIKALKTLRRALVRKLQAKFGYTVVVTSEDWNIFTHYSWTYQDALAWMACYQHLDFVDIRQNNLSGQRSVAIR